VITRNKMHGSEDDGPIPFAKIRKLYKTEYKINRSELDHFWTEHNCFWNSWRN